MKYLKTINDYINEEAKLYYSKDFIDINDALASRNDIIGDIAKNIALLMNSDVDFDINFIQPSEVEGSLKYGSYKVNVGKNPKINFEDSNSIEVRNFLNNMKNISGKGNIRMGKFINTLFPNKYKSTEIDRYIKAFYSVMNDESDYIKIVDGNDIRKYYNQDIILSNSGSLGNSCMGYYTCYNFFDIYVDNPDKVKLLLLLDTETHKVKARALLWTVDKNPLFDILMDRVYSIDDISNEKMIREAISNKWGYKTTNSHSQQKMITFDGKQLYLSLSVTLNNKKGDGDYSYKLYPYMDTFSRYNLTTGVLYNDARTDVNNCLILMAQNGGYQGSDYNIWSDYENAKIPSDDSVWSEAVNSYLSMSNSMNVERSENVDNVGFYPIGYEGICHSSIDDKYYFENECFYSEIHNTFLYKDDSLEVIMDIDDSFNIEDVDYDLKDRQKYRVNSVINTDFINEEWYIEFCKDKWESSMGSFYGVSKNLIVLDNDDKCLLEDLSVMVYVENGLSKEDSIILGESVRDEDDINYVYIMDYIDKLSERVNIPEYLDDMKFKINRMDDGNLLRIKLENWYKILKKNYKRKGSD